MSTPFYDEGRYRCEVIDQGLSKAATGTVQIVLKVRVLEGTTPERELTQQYERTIYLSVTDKTMKYLVPKLQALGYSRDSFRFISLSEPNYEDLRGTAAEFYCKHEDGQGGLREKWDVATIRSTELLDLKPVGSKELRELDLLFGRERKSSGIKPAASTVSPARARVDDGPAPSLEVTDDDVPF